MMVLENFYGKDAYGNVHRMYTLTRATDDGFEQVKWRDIAGNGAYLVKRVLSGPVYITEPVNVGMKRIKSEVRQLPCISTEDDMRGFLGHWEGK